jgi:hypothetical protein
VVWREVANGTPGLERVGAAGYVSAMAKFTKSRSGRRLCSGLISMLKTSLPGKGKASRDDDSQLAGWLAGWLDGWMDG